MCRFMGQWLRLIITGLMMVVGIICGGAIAHADPITDAENWFNEIKTLKGRFIQVSDDGSYAEGDIYLKRPYWSRFEYDAPLDTILITTKVWLHVDEKDRKTLTSYPISETPLGILFNEQVRLSLDDVTTSASSKEGIVSIELNKLTGDDAGVLVLEFTEQPFELRRWIIIDSAGIETIVTFQNFEKDIELSQKLFVPSNYQQ